MRECLLGADFYLVTVTLSSVLLPTSTMPWLFFHLVTVTLSSVVLPAVSVKRMKYTPDSRFVVLSL